MNRKPLGSEVKADLRRNCLLCTRWVACRDPQKDSFYACSKFSKEHDFNLEEVFEKDSATETAYSRNGSGLLVPNNSLPAPLNRGKYNSQVQVTAIGESEKEDPDGTMSAIINKVLNSGVPVPPDLRIDDQDIPRPKNIVEWVMDDMFIGGEDPPFGKQIQIMSHYMAEWCPRCSDEDYFEDVPVQHRYDKIAERVVFLENGKCPKCRRNKVELIEDYDLKDPFELIAIVGQRGSKTITATMIESYNMARWLMTPNIPSTYSIKSSTILTFTVTATTFNQAKENFWMPFDTLINGSEWFRNYHRFLDDVGNRYGEELYKYSETVMAYRHKNLFASPASPSQRSLRGRTRASAIIDEGGWFKVGKTKGGGDFERMNGEEVYTALSRSLTTLKSAYRIRREANYYNLPKPLMTLISSPSARNDLIMTKFREAQGSREVYYCKYPTWEFNPLVPRKFLDEDFRRRPIESERDFGCNPPMAMNPWIADEDLVFSSFSMGRNLISTTTRRARTKSKKLVTTASYRPVGKLNAEYGGVMGIDAGLNNNCLAGETKVITRHGIVPIKNLNGDVEILTEGNRWVTGHFKEYGKQQLYEIDLYFNGKTKTIRATGNHRWFAYKNRHFKTTDEVFTKDLRVGSILERVLPPKKYEDITPSCEGIEHGIVFGDGHVTKTKNYEHTTANIVGNKINFLLSYFKHYKTRGKYWEEIRYNNNDIVKIHNLPRKYKNLPQLDCDLDYLLGFVIGYIATDGCVDEKGSVMLHSTTKNNLLRIRSICDVLGLATSPITEQKRLNPYTGKLFTCYKVVFLQHSFSSNLLLNPEHKRRFESNKTKKLVRNRWKVISVRKTDAVEMTYCAEVPETHSFVLEDYILTGNSFSIAIAYPTSIPDPDDENNEDIFVGIQIPIIVEIIPKKEYPISFNGVYNEIIKPLCEEFNVALVVSDRWQNRKIMDDLDAALGLETMEIKLKLAEFDDFKQCMFDNLIELPKIEMERETIVNMSLDNYPDCFAKSPASHLAFQMLTVQNTGNAIVKGEDGTTDDILRACVIAHAAIQNEEILQICMEYTMEDNGPKFPAGFMAGASGGNSGVTTVSNFGVRASRVEGGGAAGNASSFGVSGSRR